VVLAKTTQCFNQLTKIRYQWVYIWNWWQISSSSTCLTRFAVLAGCVIFSICSRVFLIARTFTNSAFPLKWMLRFIFGCNSPFSCLLTVIFPYSAPLILLLGCPIGPPVFLNSSAALKSNKSNPGSYFRHLIVRDARFVWQIVWLDLIHFHRC
jgi:hypothetical protein